MFGELWRFWQRQVIIWFEIVKLRIEIMCRRNAREDAREYAIRFPRRLPHPNYNVFLRLVYRTRDTGSLVPTWQEIGGPPREVRTPETEETVLHSLDDDDRRSISSAFFKNRVRLISKIFQETHKTVSNSIFWRLFLQFLNSTQRQRRHCRHTRF
jgi:hypothetical protein